MRELETKSKARFSREKETTLKNIEKRKLMDNMLGTTTSWTLTRASFSDCGYDFNLPDTLEYPHHKNNSSASFNFLLM